METATSQGLTFLATLIAGIVTGLIFDIYRLMRGATRPKGLMTLLQDVLFWLIVTAILFYTLIRSNWGEVRLYVFIGWATGAIIYKVTVSSFVVMSLVDFLKFLGMVFDGFVSMLTYLYDALVRPFKLFSYRLKRRRRSEIKEGKIGRTGKSDNTGKTGSQTEGGEEARPKLFVALVKVFSKFFRKK